MEKILAIIGIMSITGILSAQDDIDVQISKLEKEYKQATEDCNVIACNIEYLKLKRILRDIRALGLPAFEPGKMVVYHCAYAFCYSEEHEQSKWVVHIVTPDIVKGNVSRTNDFREDSLVPTGTATKADYWFSGFDRGHLAPSADFRWSQKALSESYYYSNMAPQRPELNRGRWAQLEGTIRQYVESVGEQVFVVTGGILNPGLPVMQTEGKRNNVSIPEYFYKVVLDYSGDKKAGIAFVMPNAKCDYPVMSYAVTIDSVEKLTGIDFFHALPDDEENRLEGSIDIDNWQTGKEKGDALPMSQKELPKGTYNTVQAKTFKGKEITVCGTVVSTKYHEKSGGTFINLDKKFPNQVFSVTIWKNNRVNFSYLPEDELMGKRICIKGEVGEYKGTPTMTISNEKQISFMDEDEEY